MGIGGAIGGIVGGIAQNRAAKSAASAQKQAADDQIAFNKEIYADQTARFSPYLDSGTNALAAYNFEMGLGGRPMVGAVAPQIEEFQASSEVFQPGLRMGRDERGRGRMVTTQQSKFRVGDREFASRDEAQAFAGANKTGGTEYGGFKATPSYDFRRKQGIGAIDASAAVRGGLMSGRTMQDLATFGDGLASQEYDGYMQRLAGLTDMGMGAAGMQASAGSNAAAGVSNALANKGNAAAAGAIGQGNALAGMLNNLGGAFGYMNKPTAGAGAAPLAFGGGR